MLQNSGYLACGNIPAFRGVSAKFRMRWKTVWQANKCQPLHSVILSFVDCRNSRPFPATSSGKTASKRVHSSGNDLTDEDGWHEYDKTPGMPGAMALFHCADRGGHPARTSSHGAASPEAGCSGAAAAQERDQGSGGAGDDTGDRAGFSRSHGARPRSK